MRTLSQSARKWRKIYLSSFIVPRQGLNEIRECHLKRSQRYDVNRNDVTLYDVMLWRSFLYQMCEKDCTIDM